MSAIALASTSLPMVALMLPPVPVEPQVWQVGLALLVVWLAAFRIQSVRYARFHEALAAQGARAHAAAAVRRSRGPAVPARPVSGRRQRGRSGQTSGGVAAR